MFLNGLDMNYVPIMKAQGIKWMDEDKQEIDDLFEFFKQMGANCLRIRIWVGDSGPSRLPYALNLAEMACNAGMKIQPTIFLSDGWADLYKQPEPKSWASLDFREKIRLIEFFISKVIKKLMHMRDSVAYYQIGNEIDYGICGIFAKDKKKRKSIKWLRDRVWQNEANVLKEAIDVIRTYDSKPIALHLGKWWDLGLSESFLSTMDEFNVKYDIACFSFYPTMFGSDFGPLERFVNLTEKIDKSLAIAEYAYPSKPLKGQFWYMNKPSPGYPLTSEGQSSWIGDFLARCLELDICGVFYWSPELYFTKKNSKGITGPVEMPLNFGWGPMSFFDEDGRLRPCANSLRYGI